MSIPAPGIFIRPVGPSSFRYCYRVIRIFENRVQCARWGLRNRLPFDDGHVSQPNSLVDLLPVRPGVWKVDRSDGDMGDLCPVYFVLTGDPDGQLDLFGATV